MKRADQVIDVRKITPGDSKDRARAMLISLGLTFGSLISFVVMLLMWFLVYHDSLTETFIVFAALLVGSALCCVGSYEAALGKKRPWLWWIGALNGQGAVIAFIVGFFLYFRFLCYYFKYEEMRTYTNIAASQDPSAFSDGSMFLFTEDTRIDPMRSVGFKSKWTGERYCVAPIVDSSMTVGNTIDYWAVGTDCCRERSEFYCDSAEDTQTRSALVVLEPQDVARPYMKWAVRGTDYPHFLEAVRLQEASYSTRASFTPKLVRWTRDPIALKDVYYTDAKLYATTIGVVYGVFLLVGTYFLAWRLIPMQRKEGVIRHHT